MKRSAGILVTTIFRLTWFCSLNRSRPWQVIFGSAAIGALGSFATHSILPALSTIRTDLQSDIGVTQLIVSLSLLSLGVGQLFVAPLSDRYGRRPVILISCFGLGCDYFLMALAPDLNWLFVGVSDAIN